MPSPATTHPSTPDPTSSTKTLPASSSTWTSPWTTGSRREQGTISFWSEWGPTVEDSGFKIRPKMDSTLQLLVVSMLVTTLAPPATGATTSSARRCWTRGRSGLSSGWVMDPLSSRRWTAIRAPSVSFSVHEKSIFCFSCFWIILQLIYHGAGTVVHLLLLKCSMGGLIISEMGWPLKVRKQG